MADPEPDGLLGALTRDEREICRLLDMFPAPALICRDGLVVRANVRAAVCFAAKEGQALVGRKLASLVQRTSSAPGRASCILHRLDGTRRVADFSQSDDDPGETVVILHERPSASEASHLASLAMAIFAATDEAMLITDARQIILSVNPAFERVTGYSAGEAIGRTPKMLSSGRHDAHFYKEMWGTLLRDGHWHGEIWNRRKNGELYVQRITLSVLRGEEGQVVNYVAVFSDITNSKREVDRIRHLANHDSLTRLPNRVLLQDRIEQALAQASRGDGRAALLFLDLDGFKGINDRMGHLVGDRVLEAVAGRLCGCVRESDTVARIGGDEFVILLPLIREIGDAKKLAAKLLGVLSEPFVFPEGEARVGVSIGIAAYPGDGGTGDALLAAADRAMYCAKRRGGHRIVFADQAEAST